MREYKAVVYDCFSPSVCILYKRGHSHRVCSHNCVRGSKLFSMVWLLTTLTFSLDLWLARLWLHYNFDRQLYEGLSQKPTDRSTKTPSLQLSSDKLQTVALRRSAHTPIQLHCERISEHASTTRVWTALNVYHWLTAVAVVKQVTPPPLIISHVIKTRKFCRILNFPTYTVYLVLSGAPPCS